MNYCKYQTAFYTTIFFLFFSFTTLSQENYAVDSLKEAVNIVDDSLKADAYNLLAFEYITLNQDSVLFYAEKALEVAEEADIWYQKARAFRNIGKYYLFKYNVESSLKAFEKALEIDKAYGSDKGVASTYSGLANVYSYMRRYKRALEYDSLSYVHFKQADIKEGITLALSNMGHDYLRLDKPDKALDYFQRGLVIMDDKPNMRQLLRFHYNIATIYYKNMANYQKGRNHFDTALVIAENTKNWLYVGYVKLMLAEISIEQRLWPLALKNLQGSEQMMKRVESLELKQAYEKIMMQYLRATRHYEEALEYYDTYVSLKDSLFTKQQNERLSEFEIRYKTEKQQHKIDLLEQEKRVSRFRMMVLLLSFIALLIAAMFIYVYQQMKIKRSTVEQQKLEEELEHRNRELTSNVLYMVQKNELIERITGRLIESKENLMIDNQRVISEIISELKRSHSDNLWEEFDTRFRQVHHEFYDRLLIQFPDLSPNDLKLCALLRLNMTSKDIAAITHVNYRSVEVARSRMRKKLNLSNTEINLVSFLMKY